MTNAALQQPALGITFHVDTNFPDDPTRAAVYLRVMSARGGIALRIATVGPRELARSNNPKIRDLATGYPIAREVAVVGHSEFGRSVWGSDGDGELLEALKRILAPGNSESARARVVGDAIHLHTAVKYGADGIVTRDRKDMVNRATALREYIEVYTPEQAARVVWSRRRDRRTAGRTPQRGTSSDLGNVSTL